jgi:hypothetical protein
MITVVQPVVGDCFVTDKLERVDNKLVATVSNDNSWKTVHTLADDDILWVARTMTGKEVDALYSDYKLKKAVVSYGDGFKKALVTDNKYSADRIVLLFGDKDSIVEFSTWKSLVEIFIKYGE